MNAPGDTTVPVTTVLLTCVASMAFASLLLVATVLRLRAPVWPAMPISWMTPTLGLVLLSAGTLSAAKGARGLPTIAGLGFLAVLCVTLAHVRAHGAGPGAVFWALALAHAMSVLVAIGCSLARVPARGAWVFATVVWAVVLVAMWGV